MISHITITCFAASYLVAWLLELLRPVLRFSARGPMMIAFAAAGFFAQTLYLGYRATQSARLPLSSGFDWYLLAAWMLAGVFLYLTFYYPRAGLGLFLWPLVLGLIGAATWFADRQPIAPEPASQVWGMIHGSFLLLGTVTVMIGFVAGLMYLVQAMRLKRKQFASSGMRLPSLETLEHVNARVVLVSALLVGVGFLAGIILNLIGGKTQLPWTDPVVWSSGLMLVWLVAAALFNAIYRPARHGRKVAYLTIVSFLFLAVVLGMMLLVNTQHGGQKAAAAALGASESSATVPAEPPGGQP